MLRDEDTFLVAATAGRFDPEARRRAFELLARRGLDFNWGRVLDMAARHKVLCMLAEEVKRGGLCDLEERHLPLIPPAHARLLRTLYEANQLRTAGFVDELERLVRVLADASVPVLTRKGIYLGRTLYGDAAVRQSSDIDLLILPQYAEAATQALHATGYVQGQFRDGQYIPFSRKYVLTLAVSIPNLPAFTRELNRPFHDSIVIDVTRGIFDYRSGYSFPIETMFERATTWTLGGTFASVACPADFLIDLCAHFFKEAKSLLLITEGTDLTLSKCADVAWFARSVLDRGQWPDFVDRVAQAQIGVPMAFALAVACSAYPSAVPPSRLAEVGSVPETVLHGYGESEGQPAMWEAIDPLVRLFDTNRRSDMSGTSRFPTA